MMTDVDLLAVNKQLNADLVETKACYRILKAENKELIEVVEALISANDYARHCSLRDEPPRGSIWGDVRSRLDAAKLKAEIILMKVKQAKAKP